MEIKLTFKYLILAILLHIGGNILHAQTSPFAQGHWVKLTIEESGVYKLPFDTLRAWGFDDPEHIAVYGNGAEMPQCIDIRQPALYSDTLLKEIPIDLQIAETNDRDSNYLFYAEGPSHLKDGKFQHHEWSNETFYFVTNIKEGKRVVDVPEFIKSTTDTVKLYTRIESIIQIDAYAEENETCHSYGTWLLSNQPTVLSVPLGKINSSGTKVYSLNYHNVLDIENAKIKISALGFDTIFNINSNFNYGITEGHIKFITENHISQVSISLESESGDGKIMINSLSVNLFDSLFYDTKPYVFEYFYYDNLPQDWMPFDTTCLVVKTDNNNIKIWNVSDKYETSSYQVNYSPYGCDFCVSKFHNEKFVFFRVDDITVPEKTNIIENSNLFDFPATNYLIVTHPDFINEAESLAQFRRDYNSLSVEVVSVNDIYNVFTSGKKDPAAIRLFTQFLYEKGKNTSDSLQYLLLFGHGVSNTKLGSNNKYDKIPTYSAYEYGDAFYACINETELWKFKHYDIAIGRIPSITLEEAKTSVDKIINYETTLGVWNNNITMIAGNADCAQGMLFYNTIDFISRKTQQKFPEYALEKIYFDLFDESETKLRNDSIISLLNIGQRIVGYYGHSTDKGWWNGLDTDDAKSLNNVHQPILISHSCYFAEFDNSNRCIAEELLFNKHGGMVAVLGGVRRMTAAVMGYEVFNLTTPISMLDSISTLGQILTKYDISNREILLGDPCLTFGRSTHRITHVSISQSNNVLSVSGEIGKDKQLNGKLFYSLYKSQKSQVLEVCGNDAFNVDSLEKKVLSDETDIFNGEFDFSINTDVLSQDVDSFKLRLYGYSNSGDIFVGHEIVDLRKYSTTNSIHNIDAVFIDGQLIVNNSSVNSYTVTVYDVFGRKYLNQKGCCSELIRIDFKSFNMGIYIVLISDEFGNSKTIKVLNE